MKLRSSQQMTLVLAEFLSARDEWHYGYNMSRNTGLKSGTLYPLLARLADHGLLETSWAEGEDGKPPRHMYRLTQNGMLCAIEQTSSTSLPATSGKPVEVAS
jgi:PadR family transcriptional regulator, regulatory protein PadR